MPIVKSSNLCIFATTKVHIFFVMSKTDTMINCIDWGMVPYAEAWERQHRLFDEKIRQKQEGLRPANDFILCQHPHVYTIGRHGKDENMLLSPERLQQIGAEWFHIDRGGDITYHGPGQTVGYPVFDLEQLSPLSSVGRHLGLKEYIFLLEQMIINVLAEYGVRGERLQGATGVWIEPASAQARKICAIGVRASRYVTMHGFALNVNTDLNYFSYINPCGFVDKGVTSLARELGHEVPVEEVNRLLQAEARRLFCLL